MTREVSNGLINNSMSLFDSVCCIEGQKQLFKENLQMAKFRHIQNIQICGWQNPGRISLPSAPYSR